MHGDRLKTGPMEEGAVWIGTVNVGHKKNVNKHTLGPPQLHRLEPNPAINQKSEQQDDVLMMLQVT